MKQSWLIRPLSMALFSLLPSMYAASVYASATLTALPTSLNFGYQVTGTTSAVKPVTIKNTGTTTATGVATAVTGDYIANTTCTATLAASATCTVNVAFKPTALGTRAGTLNITSTNAAAVNVALTGIGPTAAGAWNPAATINAKRIYHTATKLADGKILIVGGYNENGGVVVSNSVERLDLYTGSTIVDNLTTPRGYHTATLLPTNCGNRVLVTGGIDSNNAIVGTAEWYDPITMTWSSAGTMSKARYSHTATLLPGTGCKVLITGGIDAAGNYLSNSEIYTATLNTATTPHTWISTWSNTGNLNTGRSWHTATVLTNGKVLVTGGNSVDFLRSSELYDPTNGTWTFTGNLVTGRNSHTATLLANNKVLVVGGYNDSKGGSLNDAETYDQTTGLWTSAATLSFKRNQHTETRLHNGEVLITGGVNESGAGGANVALNSAEVYNPSTNAWQMVSVPMGVARFGHTATLLDIIEVASDVKKVSGKVYVVGGSDDISGALDTSALYSPVAVTLKATEIKFNGTATTPTTGITAKLNGRVTTTNANGPTTVTFDFGSTTSYGSSVPVSGAIPVSQIDKDVSATTGVLACGGFEYHYRIKTVTAINTANTNTIYGSDQTFKTLPCKTTDLKILLTDNKTVVQAGTDTTYVATITNLGPAPDVVARAILKAPMVGNLTATSVNCTATPIGVAECPTVANTTVGLLQGTGIIIPKLPKSATAKLIFNIKAKVAINAPNGSTITYATSITAPNTSFVDNNLSNNNARDSTRVNNPTPLPDLMITGITVTPASPKINTTFSAAVTVKNMGTKPIAITDGVFLDVWANRAANATCGLEGDAFASLETLAVGASKSFTVSMTASPIAGAKVLRAYIDSTCGVIEFDEANNQAVKNYTVSP